MPPSFERKLKVPAAQFRERYGRMAAKGGKIIFMSEPISVLVYDETSHTDVRKHIYDIVVSYDWHALGIPNVYDRLERDGY